MRKAFLLAFSDTLGTREQVKNCLNNCPSVLRWRYDMSHAFYIISEATADTISKEIRNFMNNDGYFIVVEINTSTAQGWLTKASWYLINEKEYMKE